MNIRHLLKTFQTGTVVSAIKRKIFAKPCVVSEKNVFQKQHQLLRKMLKYATQHCEFYKNMESTDLAAFPIVNKHIISDKFDDFCSDIKDKYAYGHSYTGGSTGEPFHLLNCTQFEQEFGVKRWNYYGYQKGDVILALDGSKISEEDIEKGVFWKKKNSENVPFGTLALSSLYLTDATAKIYCEYILSVKPAFIRGYPSFVYAIACYSEKLGLNMKNFLKAVELTSETIHTYQIEKIKAVFNTKVYLQYGHTEACVCAYTFDETYRYRVEPLYGYVEILDAEGKHVSKGEIGEVVVTGLHNYVMPLIRYRTGDFAEYGGRDDRYLYLNRVLGRTQDYIVAENGDKALLTAVIFGQHFKAMGHIDKWQIEQFERGHVVLHIIKGGGYTLEDEKELSYLFKKLANVTVKFDYTNHIALTPRGKSKMLIQHIQW